MAYELAVINDLKYPSSWDENEMAGVEWCKGFMKRHPLSLRKPESCSFARNTNFNRHHIDVFYDNLFKVLQDNPQIGADPSRVFNLDETGTTTHYVPEK